MTVPSIRIDVALKHLCLVRSRSRAQAMCESGAVRVNGRPARPASPVRLGDFVEIVYPERTVRLELLELPVRQKSRADAPACYRILSTES